MTDDAFLARFEAGRLGAFTHRDHVRLAFAYTRRGGVEHAIERARHGLRRFAAAHGQPERYHETLTIAWARVVAHHATDAGDFESLVAVHPRLLDRELLFAHYSRELLFGPTARARFVEPDLLALPQRPRSG